MACQIPTPDFTLYLAFREGKPLHTFGSQFTWREWLPAIVMWKGFHHFPKFHWERMCVSFFLKKIQEIYMIQELMWHLPGNFTRDRQIWDHTWQCREPSAVRCHSESIYTICLQLTLEEDRGFYWTDFSGSGWLLTWLLFPLSIPQPLLL